MLFKEWDIFIFFGICENLKNNIGKELYVFFCINIYRIRICLELVLMGKILCGEER